MPLHRKRHTHEPSHAHRHRDGIATTFLCTALLVIGLGLYASARAAQVTLRWDYDASGAAGFMLYCGLSSRSYTTRIDVGNTDTYRVTLADGATHFCSVTAYDPARVESAYSGELRIPLAATAPPAPTPPPAAPTVAFAPQPSSGRAPLDVVFANTTAGQVTSWIWSFGDGGTSSLWSPTHRYLQPGTYYVALTAVGPGGTRTLTSSTPITVSASAPAPTTPPPASTPPPAAPTVAFTPQPSSGRAPLDVGFANTTAGQVTSWIWSFGDGGTSSLWSPTHRYLQPGTYYVALTAVGPGGTRTLTSSTPITVSTSGGANASLVAAYGFDEGTGSSVTDLSGKGNVGTLAGTTWSSTGRFGKSLYFNGSSSRVTIKDSPSLDVSGAMTLAAWVYPTVAMTGNQVVIVKERPGSNAYHLHASGATSGRVLTGIFTTTPNQLWSAAPIAANRWTHLAATYDGAMQRLFVNGVQVASRAQRGAIATSGNPLRIGADGVRGEYFRGRIDEVRIYNRALSSTEIQAIMNTAVSAR